MFPWELIDMSVIFKIIFFSTSDSSIIKTFKQTVHAFQIKGYKARSPKIELAEVWSDRIISFIQPVAQLPSWMRIYPSQP